MARASSSELKGATDVDLERDTMEREILSALENAALEIGLPLAERVRYGGSATEQEIVSGLFRDSSTVSNRRDPNM